VNCDLEKKGAQALVHKKYNFSMTYPNTAIFLVY
jgi:hypothetical protein